MNRRRDAAAVLVLFVFLTAGCQTTTSGTVEQQLEDKTITTEVKSRFATTDRVGALTRIEVKTVENTVYLIGVVPTLQEKNRAEEIARHVDDVRRVVSHIMVQPVNPSTLRQAQGTG